MRVDRRQDAVVDLQSTVGGLPVSSIFQAGKAGGQGIGTIKDVVAAADRISDLKVQYEAAKDYLKAAYG